MTEFTAEFVADIIRKHSARCLAASAIGVALCDVVNGTKEVPLGWLFDDETYFYVPPNLALDTLETMQ